MANYKISFIFSLFFALLTFLALNLSVSAQTIKIRQEDFSAARQKAFEQLKGKPQRIIYKSVTRLERSTSSFENVTEIIPPNKRRFLSKNTAEPKNSIQEFTAEIIEIGEKRFTRKDDGAWTETSMTLDGPENKTQGDKLQTQIAADYYFLGETILNGQPADLYEIVVQDKLKTKQLSGKETETLVLSKTRYWFGKNGLWIRDESEYEFSDAANEKVTHTQQMTRTYEYAPNIKLKHQK